MEKVSPYSTDVVFLAQLVIITAYSQCAAVNTTIRNATMRCSLLLHPSLFLSISLSLPSSFAPI